MDRTTDGILLAKREWSDCSLSHIVVWGIYKKQCLHRWSYIYATIVVR